MTNLKKWEEAEGAFLNAIELEPRNALHVNSFGNALFGSGNYERAVEQYLKALEIDSENKVYLDNLILACAGLRDSKRAVAILEKAFQYLRDPTEITRAIEKLKRA